MIINEILEGIYINESGNLVELVRNFYNEIQTFTVDGLDEHPIFGLILTYEINNQINY